MTTRDAIQDVADYLWETELISAIDYLSENGTLEGHIFLQIFYLNAGVHGETEKLTWEQSCERATALVAESQ